jgi:hypothetical protein
MFSEIQSERTAEKLEEVLLIAIAVGGDVKAFAKTYLYQWYLDECGETYGSHHEILMIKREFEEEEKE